MVKKGLGKGLDALFPQAKGSVNSDNVQNNIKNEMESLNSNVYEIEISKIITNKEQPRKIFDNSKIEELSESIKKFRNYSAYCIN